MWEAIRKVYSLYKKATKIFEKSRASKLVGSVTKLWGENGETAQKVVDYATTVKVNNNITYSDIENADSDFWDYCRDMGYEPEEMSHQQCVEAYKDWVGENFEKETGLQESDLLSTAKYISSWIKRNS